MVVSKEKFFELLEQGREDNSWDYKRDLKIKPNESFYQLLKDILAFSNTEGGHLVLGVEDKEHKLIGVTNQIDEAELGSKIQTTLGYSINIKLLYFKHECDGETKTLGLLYIPKSNQLNLSPKDLTGQKGAIIQANIPYVRRNTQSVLADKDDYEKLLNRIQKQNNYEFKERDLEILIRNRDRLSIETRIYNYLTGDFKFTTNEFSHKLNWLYYSQHHYNKLEFGRLIGFEDHKIDDYFEGKASPTLEQILRISLICRVPADYFFRPTINDMYPIWQYPIISYSIIDKITNRDSFMFIEHEGKFFRDVLWELSKGIRLFINWVLSETPKDISSNPSDGHFFSPMSLYAHFYEWPVEKIDEFKEHLCFQHYKILELFDTSENVDEILSSLIFLPEDLTCRVIIESIKEINIKNGKPQVKLHFLEEIKNKQYNRREYRNLKLEISE
ncbi:AlbA family DNA-binding domain-containing protein [Bacillus halotolerans]|uniref:AlbA family DNA-binding domain-containing protein n=1 Tax=Bacillus halotolerans TaxID=260554 RepID=UPI000D081CFF|nr:RNA-binding domain-containing protein [Bacillus halotolerans]PSA98076.1 ATP-binding protein [Bacillus halotolerans]